MVFWGSWPSLQKMNKNPWPFQYFYWDYIVGFLIISTVLAMTLGSYGDYGREFIEDLLQADYLYLCLALLGAVIWNLGNICIFIAIQIAGMAIAFPIAIGLSLILGVVLNYLAQPIIYHPWLLFVGMVFIVIAILFDGKAYRLIEPQSACANYKKGILISIISGILFGLFYLFFAQAMATNFKMPTPGHLTPYTALFIFASGAFFSNILFNSVIMKKPMIGNVLDYRTYFKSVLMHHSYGVIAGVISGLGTYLSFIAFGVSGAAISFGIGNGSTMIAALWGLLVWREFRNAPKIALLYMLLMLVFYIVGLVFIALSKA